MTVINSNVDWLGETTAGQVAQWAQNGVLKGTTTLSFTDKTLSFAPTWNHANFKYTGIKLNVTNTASNSESYLIDLQVDGVSKFALDREGNMIVGGTGFGGGGGDLGDLDDVTITSIASGELVKWNGSAWVNNTLAEAGIAAASHTHTESDITDLGSYMSNLTDDTTPQLAGSLDVNGQKIVSTSNGNIDIEPNGTGNVLLGNLTFDADQTIGAGQDDYVLTYDNATGLVSLEAAAGGAPGGSDTQIQFNDGGSFGGSANLTWDGTTFSIGSTAGIDINPGSDIDADLITVGVTDTPKLYWDESQNGFVFKTASSATTFLRGYNIETLTAIISGWNGQIQYNVTQPDGVGNTAIDGNGTIGRLAWKIDSSNTKADSHFAFEFDGSGASSHEFWFGGHTYMLEAAAADGNQAGYGQLWVKNDTPNVLMFTDDAGTDHDIIGGLGGGGVALSDNNVWTGTNEFDAAVQMDAAVTVTGTDGIDYNPGSDVDADLITVGVTGAPKIYWDESGDRFNIVNQNGIYLESSSDSLVTKFSLSGPTTTNDFRIVHRASDGLSYFEGGQLVINNSSAEFNNAVAFNTSVTLPSGSKAFSSTGAVSFSLQNIVGYDKTFDWSFHGAYGNVRPQFVYRGGSTEDFVLREALTLGADIWGWDYSESEFDIYQDLRLDGAVNIDTTTGIDINPGSDVDADLITVGVTGSPTMSWDESQDAFSFSHQVDIAANESINFLGNGFIRRIGSMVISFNGGVECRQWLELYDVGIRFSSGGVDDLFLRRDAANTLALRNSTNAQTLNLYNTWTDASNYELGAIFWSSDVFTIDTQESGTGTARGIQIGAAAAATLGFHGATPVAQQATTGTTTGFTAGSGTAANDDSTYTGGSGSKAYTVGDIVLALKNLGLLAAS